MISTHRLLLLLILIPTIIHPVTMHLLFSLGLAYTQLAGLPTSYGLYASFMPPLIYALLGTSRELSVGPFALVSLAVAQAIGQLEPSYSDLAVTDPAAAQALAVKVAMPLTLVVGLLTILMAVLQLGWVISFFSKPALSGFLVASAYTISTTQVASILQVRLASDSSFVESWTVIASAIPHANVASVLIGIVCVAVLLGMDYIFRPPRVKATIPWPLFVTIASILISYLGDFHYRYGVKVVGDVQASFPTPYFPTVPDVAQYIQAAVSLTMVNFVVAMSIVVEMASENGYAVDTNQETFALGCCGVVGSCFSAYVPAGSLSRSVVANKMKPGSTLWNLVLFAIIALCIAVLSPLLYHLPSATLAAIIIAAFKVCCFIVVQQHRYKKNDQSAYVISFTIVFPIHLPLRYFLSNCLPCTVLVYRTCCSAFLSRSFSGRLPLVRPLSGLQRSSSACFLPPSGAFSLPLSPPSVR